MTSADRVKRWREKQKTKQGGASATFWLSQETAEKFEELRHALGLKNDDIISQAIKTLYEVTCNKKTEKPPAEIKTGGKLLMEICDRHLKEKIPVKDMKEDMARALSLMLQDQYTADELKKLLNEYRLPTISGKPKWTLEEIRKLTRYYATYSAPEKPASTTPPKRKDTPKP
jgi:hypothetical protein